MQSAAFPLGAVRVSEPGHVTERDEGVVPFDYTLYTGRAVRAVAALLLDQL